MKRNTNIKIENEELRLLVPVGINGPSPSCLSPLEISKELKNYKIMPEIPIPFNRNKDNSLIDLLTNKKKYFDLVFDENLSDFEKIITIRRVPQKIEIDDLEKFLEKVSKYYDDKSELYVRVPYRIAKDIEWGNKCYPIIKFSELNINNNTLEREILNSEKIGVYVRYGWSAIEDKLVKFLQKSEKLKIIILGLNEKDKLIDRNIYSISFFAALKYKNIVAVGSKYPYIDFPLTSKMLSSFTNSKFVNETDAVLVTNSYSESFKTRIKKIAKLITEGNINKKGIRVYFSQQKLYF